MFLFSFQRPPAPPSQSAPGGSAPTDLPYIPSPPNASSSSIPPANGPPPTDGSQPIPSPTSPVPADGTRPTGLPQGDPAPNNGGLSSPPASSVPSFNGPTPPAPSGSGSVGGSVPGDLPYAVQPTPNTPSSSLPLVNNPAFAGFSQPIHAPNSPAPTDGEVPTGAPMPNVSGYPSASVNDPTSSGVPPIPAPNSPAASVLPSAQPVDGTPKPSGIPDAEVNTYRLHSIYIPLTRFLVLFYLPPRWLSVHCHSHVRIFRF